MLHNKYKSYIMRLIDNELNHTLEVELNNHLLECDDCNKYLNELKEISSYSREESFTEEVSSSLNYHMIMRSLEVSKPKVSLVEKFIINFKYFEYQFRYAIIALIIGLFIGGIGFKLKNKNFNNQYENILTTQEESLFTSFSTVLTLDDL